MFRSIEEWLTGGLLERVVRSRYDACDVEDRVRAYTELLHAASGAHGFDARAPVALAASPGRDRLFMGHTDFPGLGGPTVNGATREEIVAVAQLDPEIRGSPESEIHVSPVILRLRNLSPQYTPADVDLRTLRGLPLVPTWKPEEWANYVRGAVAYLMSERFARSAHVAERVLGSGRGMRILLSSPPGPMHLPTSGGLSSSAALTSALALCLDALYGLALSLEELAQVDFGEYYLGKKAGAADKAAQLFAVRGRVVVVGSYPEAALRTVAFPRGLAVLMAQTGIPRLSTEGGVAWLAARHPPPLPARANAWAKETMGLSYVPAAEAIARGLADARACERCGISPAEAARALEALGAKPLLRDLVPLGHSLVFRALRLIPEAEMTLRQVALYGLSEVERGAQYVAALERGDVARVMQLVAWAHDGDRALVDYRKDFAATAWAESEVVNVTDAALDRWVAEGEDLASKSGAFRRSLPEIDEVATEMSQVFKGKAALRIAAAGMGGVVAVHATTDVLNCVREWLETQKGYSVREVALSPPCAVLSLPSN